ETLRPNPAIDTAAAISELAVGEALVSLLDEHGSPTVTQRAWIYPPSSRIGPITEDERKMSHDSNKQLYGPYEHAEDRESAYERLTGRTAQRAAKADQAGASAGASDAPASPEAPPSTPRTTRAEPRATPAPAAPRSEPWAQPTAPGQTGGGTDSGLAGAFTDFVLGHTGPRGGHYPGALEALGKSAARSMGSGIGRAILRGALGSILRSR